MSKTPFILFKYPSRGRPDRFIDGLNSIYNNIYDTENFHVSCTFDTDDKEYNNIEFLTRLAPFNNLSIGWGTSTSKIHAVNRTMPDVPWDIVVVTSDDIRFSMVNFDEMIRSEMTTHFPDGDGYLHFWEKDSKQALNVMPIMDRKYYDRFSWIYHPAYDSLFVDNEQTETAQILGRYHFVDCEIFQHFNPAYGYWGFEKDEMFLRQQEVGWTKDQQTYLERKARNFDL